MSSSGLSCGSIISGGSGTTTYGYGGGSYCAISLSNDDSIGGGNNCILSCSGSSDPVVSAGGSGGGGGGFGGGSGNHEGGWGGWGGSGGGGGGVGSGKCDSTSSKVLRDAMSKSMGCMSLGESSCAACGCEWVGEANMCTGGSGGGGGGRGFGGGGGGGRGGGSGKCDRTSMKVLRNAMSKSMGCMSLGESSCTACGCEWKWPLCHGSYEEDEELTSEDYDLDSYKMAAEK
mmetsp:Transcript_17670/g.29881  ORF Transcript_17670/g.29881 Transcript_17670/m.29881 type:complete len:231 (-) Transcript_17670:156-848(-)